MHRAHFAAILLAAPILWGVPAPAAAESPEHRVWPVHESRPGVAYGLSRSHHAIVYGGMHYYYDRGLWFRPWGGRLVAVVPPIGIAVPLLPPGHATLRLGERVYYHYDDVYYMRGERGYVVVDLPQSDARGGTRGEGASDELFVYPREGQNERQQRSDRFACHEWATGQTGYDPTLVGGGTDYSAARRANYLRALSACLEGRGYTVR